MTFERQQKYFKKVKDPPQISYALYRHKRTRFRRFTSFTLFYHLLPSLPSFIIVNARFTTQPPDTSVLFGERASIPCQVTGFPKPQIVWLKRVTTMESNIGAFENVQLDSGRIQQFDNGTLHFATTTVLDSGEYACKATFDTPKPPFIPERISRVANLLINGKMFQINGYFKIRNKSRGSVQTQSDLFPICNKSFSEK